jgi:hypothetical protein
MMEALAPMLAVTAREPFDAPDYLFEVKWDGIRALTCHDEGGWRLWGRDGADYRPRYPELAVLAALPAGTMLDGEIVLCSQGVPNLPLLLARHARATTPSYQPSVAPSPVPTPTTTTMTRVTRTMPTQSTDPLSAMSHAPDVGGEQWRQACKRRPGGCGGIRARSRW